MNYKLRTNKAFTLMELMVAVGLLAIVLSFAGAIFRVSIGAQRTAIANAEIMQKLRAITNQLNADFKGLRKDGEIFVVWVAKPVHTADYKDNDLDGYERFDRIMFFADGDFQSYRASPIVRGNIARICYMIAKKPPRNSGDPPIKAPGQKPEERILSRNQHIVTADPTLANFLDPNGFTDNEWYVWNNRYEYDKMSLRQWKQIPFENKKDILSVVTDVRVDVPSVSEDVWGANVDPSDPDSIHMLLCEGVGEFKVQGWYDAQQRWVPEVDPDGNGDLADTHFFMSDPNSVPGVLYPYRVLSPSSYGVVKINNITYPMHLVDELHFNAIPGLGRALKFTFTLYDSKGVIKEGRTFTHIVYLGD